MTPLPSEPDANRQRFHALLADIHRVASLPEGRDKEVAFLLVLNAHLKLLQQQERFHAGQGITDVDRYCRKN